MPAPTAASNKKKAAAANYARKHVIQTFLESKVADNTAAYPKFDLREVQLGKVLGRGGFGTVYEVRGFKITDKKKIRVSTASYKKSSRCLVQDAEVASGELESRLFIAEHCIRNNCDARYAIKILSPEVVEDPARYWQGMIDCAVEARFLSDIEHPNIVKLRALSTVDAYDPKFFIVMDRLYDTLEGRLKKWSVANGRTRGIISTFADRKGAKRAALYLERVHAGFDLAAALEYLHARNIIHRDIKPDNIGFDIRGDIKIFDFGLAKELHAEKRLADGTWKLTADTGSPCYMAPEVANEDPYNETCDCYSFAILFWQMLSLKRPFELYTASIMAKRVYNGERRRPKVDEDWNPSMKLLLKRGWSHNWGERNSMKQVVQILRKECIRLRGGDHSGLEHSRRRSTFVFRDNHRSGGVDVPVRGHDSTPI